MFKLNVGMVLGTLLLAAPAWSSLITVSNGSFENPVLPVAGSASGPRGLFGFGDLIGGITAWNITTGAGTTGIFAPNSTLITYTPNVVSPVATGATGVPITGVPNDVQVLFLQSGGSIYQDLTPIAGNGYYQVSVDVGRRTDTASGAYSLMLTSGSTVLATFNGDVSSIASAGLWARETVTYNGAAIPSLRLTLTAAGNQVGFDDVQASGAPEIGGSSVFWTMIGVAGFWIYRKKRSVA
jgi:hypothetical protein